jgi:L-seryl-tRNA(Ser) seleniumtransferase
VVTEAVRAELDDLRRRLLSKSADAADLELGVIERRVQARLARDFRPLPRMINATGVILHSGLGRAPLPDAANRAIAAMGRYHLLEVDRERAIAGRATRAARCFCAH